MPLLGFRVNPNGNMTPGQIISLDQISKDMQIFHHDDYLIHILKVKKVQPGKKNKNPINHLISFICDSENNRGDHFVYALHAPQQDFAEQIMVSIDELGEWLRKMNRNMIGAPEPQNLEPVGLQQVEEDLEQDEEQQVEEELDQGGQEGL